MSISARQQREAARVHCARLIAIETPAPWEELLGPQLTAMVRRHAEGGEVSPQTIIRECVREQLEAAR